MRDAVLGFLLACGIVAGIVSLVGWLWWNWYGPLLLRVLA